MRREGSRAPSSEYYSISLRKDRRVRIRRRDFILAFRRCSLIVFVCFCLLLRILIRSRVFGLSVVNRYVPTWKVKWSGLNVSIRRSSSFLLNPATYLKKRIIKINNSSLSNTYSSSAKELQKNVPSFQKLNPWFVTGFIDGEGCFSVSIIKNKKIKTRLRG